MLTLRARGEHIAVPDYVVQKVPFLQALGETKSSEPVDIDLVSPEILRHVIAGVQNQWNIQKFREVCRELEDGAVEDALRYLHLPEALEQFQGEAKFMDQVLVETISTIVPALTSKGTLVKQPTRVYLMASGIYTQKWSKSFYRRVEIQPVRVDGVAMALFRVATNTYLLPLSTFRLFRDEYYLTLAQYDEIVSAKDPWER